MKISIRDIFKKVGVILMLLFIGLIIANKIMYTHVHKLEDGSIVMHAHPYDKSENETGETHHHLKAELFLIQSLGLLFYTVILTVLLHLSFSVLKFTICNEKLYSGNQIFLSLGRAPPVIW